MSDKIGRLEPALVGKDLPDDQPSHKVKAMLTQQDAIIDALKALATKLDADGGVTDTDYAATLTDSLTKLSFR